MKISAKGRYALNSVLYVAFKVGCKENITLIEISEKLDISKIFLEQVFADLKKADIVKSIKGKGGGYSLSKCPSEISVYDILKVTDSSIFSKPEINFDPNQSTEKNTINLIVETELNLVNDNLIETTKNITLETLIENFLKEYNQDPMYYL